MNVDNIFDLLNKFGKEEDQISAGFGFLLKNNPKLLFAFLRKVGFRLNRNELKKVDIETQVSYDSGESRIDLQIKLREKFIIFVESKIYRNEDHVINQLKKYAKILREIKEVEGLQIKLVYVNRYAISKGVISFFRRRTKLKQQEFHFFSWEDWVRLATRFDSRETVRLFINWIGDKMYSKKIIKEQKIKDLCEVLIIVTNPQNWELITKKQIAVQGETAPDAKYLAFYRTHLGKDKRPSITHIAEVKSITMVRRSETVKGLPKLRKWYGEKERPLDDVHKQYVLGKIIKLAREIPHLKNTKTIGQQKMRTKMSELLRVTTVGQLKKLSKLDD